jgi:hypothetical protein
MLTVHQISKEEAEGAMTALLDALEHAMPAADYLKGLVSLTQNDSQVLRRRALRLFTSKMNSLQAAGEAQAIEEDDGNMCVCSALQLGVYCNCMILMSKRGGTEPFSVLFPRTCICPRVVRNTSQDGDDLSTAMQVRGCNCSLFNGGRGGSGCGRAAPSAAGGR